LKEGSIFFFPGSGPLDLSKRGPLLLSGKVLAASLSASSAEFVGKFWLREGAEVVI
jgi:hypothetical protein